MSLSGETSPWPVRKPIGRSGSIIFLTIEVTWYSRPSTLIGTKSMCSLERR